MLILNVLQMLIAIVDFCQARDNQRYDVFTSSKINAILCCYTLNKLLITR